MLNYFLFFKRDSNKGGCRHPHFDHVKLVQSDGFHFWLCDRTKAGIQVRRIKTEGRDNFLRNIKRLKKLTHYAEVYIEERRQHPRKSFIVDSCVEVSRLVSGLDVSFTLSPLKLFKKIINYPGKKFEVIHYGFTE